MRYCKKCLQPDTRYGLEFDENQVCGACLYEDEKSKINWDERKSQLIKIANVAKEKAKQSNSPYDCIIGVSGGKDSTFQAVYAKEKLGLNVLLVNSMPDDLTEEGRKNLDNLSRLGFDIIHLRPNHIIARELILRSFKEHGHIFKAYEHSVCSSAAIIAEKFNIPLIIQGENGALVMGITKYQKKDDDWFGVLNSNTLEGCNASNWCSDDIKIQQLFLYQFPNLNTLIDKGIRAIYLQYYVKEWSPVYNADFSVARGFVGRYKDNQYDIGRYRIYSTVDSDLMMVNEMLKYYKLGFGRASDDACVDIREGRISREDAIWLVNEYDGKCGDKYIKYACDYMGITEKEFWDITDKFVNKELFSKDNSTGKWIPKFKVGVDFNE